MTNYSDISYAKYCVALSEHICHLKLCSQFFTTNVVLCLGLIEDFLMLSSASKY